MHNLATMAAKLHVYKIGVARIFRCIGGGIIQERSNAYRVT